MDKEQRHLGRDPYDAFGVADLGSVAGSIGDFGQAIQDSIKPDISKMMGDMPWETIARQAQQSVTTSLNSLHGVPNIAETISREYGPMLSSVSLLSRMMGDATKENERLLRGLFDIGVVGPQVGLLSDAMRTELEAPALAAYRELINGTITPFGSLTSDSLQSLFDSFGVAESVARSATALARIMELQEQSDVDCEVDEGVSNEIEEVLNDPKMQDLMSRVLGAILTYVTMLASALGERTSKLLASPRIRRHLAGVATALIILTATGSLSVPIVIGALGSSIFILIEDALEDLAGED